MKAKFAENILSSRFNKTQAGSCLKSLPLLSLMILGLFPPVVRADYNPQRVGFSSTYPTNYSDWANAYIAGNGKLGIMVFCNPLDETVIYNDRGFNLAKSSDRSFAQVSADDLATIRSNCAAGNFADANALAVSSAKYHNGGEGNRHPGFEMLISIPPDGAISNYSRTCDFRTGVITVKWSDARGDWERKSFVSRKDDVIVQYLTAPGGKLDCSIQLTTDPGMHFPAAMTFTKIADANYLNIRANYAPNTGGAGYEGVTRMVATGGTKTVDGNILTISNATSVMLLTRSEKYYSNSVAQWNQQNLQTQLASIPADYNTLLNGQIATHEAIYDRVKLDLNASAADRAKANDELLVMQKHSPTAIKALWERIFDAGRYYYLSSSSSNTPPDLLGIWTGDCNVGWGGFYHLDANANLQVAGGNIGDMPEAMEGYFAINEAWRPDFETNAAKLLGCRGMVAGGNSPGPISGLMANINTYYPYHYATGEEGWLLYPFWEHYLITGDKEFLQTRLYPLLKEMGYFYEDFLTLTDTNGHYIFAGSVSPENQPANLKISLLNNSAFDVSGGKFCLTALVETCKILGLDQGPGQGVERWSNLLNKLPPYLINSDGALQEWSWPGLKDNYIHRHLSHMLPVWPFREITPEDSPDLFKAATVVLAKKDAYHETAGHGILHGALVATGLKNGASVNKRLLQLTKEGYYFDSLISSHNNNHGVFCTDTCNAVPGIMIEMLVGSSPGVLELLPALPPTLDQGAISDVKGRNRVTVQNLSWNMENNSVNCILKSDIEQSITLIERDGISSISTSATVSASPIGQIARTIQLQAGVNTHISIGLGQLRSAVQVATPSVELSLKHPVTVSSVANESLGANAVDGDETTRWSSAYKDNEWIYVDLGNSKTINEIKLDWEHAAGKDYDMEVSDDATTWKTVKSVTNNSSMGWLDYPGLNAKGRYVRINCKARTTEYGSSLWELQVFGSGVFCFFKASRSCVLRGWHEIAGCRYKKSNFYFGSISTKISFGKNSAPSFVSAENPSCFNTETISFDAEFVSPYSPTKTPCRPLEFSPSVKPSNLKPLSEKTPANWIPKFCASDTCSLRKILTGGLFGIRLITLSKALISARVNALGLFFISSCFAFLACQSSLIASPVTVKTSNPIPNIKIHHPILDFNFESRLSPQKLERCTFISSSFASFSIQSPKNTISPPSPASKNTTTDHEEWNADQIPYSTSEIISMIIIFAALLITIIAFLIQFHPWRG